MLDKSRQPRPEGNRNRESYTLAGWAAIASVALFIPAFSLLIFNDIRNHPALSEHFPSAGPDLLPLVILLDAASKVLMIYAYLKFRELINQRYDFHAVDRLIPILIVTGLLTGALSYAARAFEASVASMATGVMTGMIMGVLGIVYALRLLKMNGNLNGYLKPLAYTTMAGSICFLLVIFAPFGLVLMCAADVILGLAFFKGEEMEELEVV